MQTASDHRLALVRQWVAAQLRTASFSLAPASEDASFRRYFRVTADGRTWIVMDAPPGREDCRPFVQVAALMREAGLHVPGVLAQDLQRGFLLLTDLGTTTYLKALADDNADRLFGDAIEALIRLQRASRPGRLPPYDAALLNRELSLFPDWYLERHLGLPLDPQMRETLAQSGALLVASALAQPQVYVHRDYMPRNLMLSEPNPGVLDFQDAVCGPITYDLASLFRDAFITWDEARAREWVVRYWESAKRTALPVDSDFATFYRDFEWMGLQRHLKVLGIFARIHYRDGKPGYLEDTPRFLRYVRAVCERYPEFAPLLRVLDRIDRQPAATRRPSPA
ncbi:MAG: aminoglycoside phosphotransferase family protein [Betaproteobacteria bacterium]